MTPWASTSLFPLSLPPPPFAPVIAACGGPGGAGSCDPPPHNCGHRPARTGDPLSLRPPIPRGGGGAGIRWGGGWTISDAFGHPHRPPGCDTLPACPLPKRERPPRVSVTAAAPPSWPCPGRFRTTPWAARRAARPPRQRRRRCEPFCTMNTRDLPDGWRRENTPPPRVCPPHRGSTEH